MFPDDQEFEDYKLTGVKKYENGWEIQHDGLCFVVPGDSPIEPRVGMTARFYGKGFGSRVRGLYLDGVKVFYRTEAEDEEQFEIELYGADATEWLKRWDEGRGVWSIEMGGLGPGYEQCIQITAAEVLRRMLSQKYDHSRWSDADQWKHDRDEIEKWSFDNERVKELGLSGAQWGAAMNLAIHLYRDGPRKIFTDERVKDRKIQVSRTFPGMAA